jgi:hypothetical protein
MLCNLPSPDAQSWERVPEGRERAQLLEPHSGFIEDVHVLGPRHDLDPRSGFCSGVALHFHQNGLAIFGGAMSVTSLTEPLDQVDGG